jgi:hypothetical protein
LRTWGLGTDVRPRPYAARMRTSWSWIALLSLVVVGFIAGAGGASPPCHSNSPNRPPSCFTSTTTSTTVVTAVSIDASAFPLLRAVTTPVMATTFQWKQGSPSGTNFADIAGATSATYTVPAGSTASYEVVADGVTSAPWGVTGGQPSGYYWLGDFRADAQNYSAFDTHDANLANTINDPTLGTSAGSVIVAKQAPIYTASAYSSRQLAADAFPSSSTSGAASVLWQPGSYSNAWEQQGAHTWFRMIFLLPDGTDPNYPGKFLPRAGDGLSGTWHTLMEWHIDNSGLNAHGGFTAPSSTMIEVGYNTSTFGGPCLLLRSVGGVYNSNVLHYIIETNQTQHNVNDLVTGTTTPRWAGTPQLLQYNHWYDVLVYQEFDASPTIGYLEWWVDGNLRYADHLPTLVGAKDGWQGGVAFEGGLYRHTALEPNSPNEVIYMQMMAAGPTRASVGG